MDVQNNLFSAIRTLKDAMALVGGCSNPKKMPGLSYGLPTDECHTGMKLKVIPNTVCYGCYADKGHYKQYKIAVKKAQYRRLESISNPLWIKAMIYILNHSKSILDTGVFRWHDSGDIQSVEHLDKIVRIAIATPDVKHWLPTKESNWIQKYANPIPKNLVIRLSGSFVDGKEPISWSHTSTVVTDEDKATCRAFENGGECGDCRQCWDDTVKNVSYFNH